MVSIEHLKLAIITFVAVGAVLGVSMVKCLEQSFGLSSDSAVRFVVVPCFATIFVGYILMRRLDGRERQNGSQCQ